MTNFDERVLGLQEMVERLRAVPVGGSLAELEHTAGVRTASWLTFLSGNLLVSNWDGYMNNYFLHHAVGGDELWDIMPWDLDKTSGLSSSGSGYASRQDHDMPAQMGLDGRAPHDARPLNPDGVASLNKAVLSHCEFNARFRSVMAAAANWFGGADVAAAVDAQEAGMLAQLVVIEAANGGSRDNTRRQQIQQGHAGIRMYVASRAAFLLQRSPRMQQSQCTPSWCVAGQPSTVTLMATVTATHTIQRQGSGASCTFANGPPPPPSRWHSNTPVDCSRSGGLAAVGSGGRTCVCCTVGPLGGALAVAPPVVAATTTCPTVPGDPSAPAPAPAPAASDDTGGGGASTCGGGGGGGGAPCGGGGAPPADDSGQTICRADVDGDGTVRVPDLLLLLSFFGYQCPGGGAGDPAMLVGDVNDDCRVAVADALLVLAAFGRTC